MYLSIGMKKGPPRFITLDLPWRTLDGMEPWADQSTISTKFPLLGRSNRWFDGGPNRTPSWPVPFQGKAFFFQFQLNKRNRKLVVNYRISCGDSIIVLLWRIGGDRKSWKIVIEQEKRRRIRKLEKWKIETNVNRKNRSPFSQKKR